MQQRFEILPEPIEDRLQRGLTEQAVATWSTVHLVLETITNNTNYAFNATSDAFSDHEFVGRVFGTGLTLLSPRSLPGCLFMFAIAFRVVRAFMISRMAHKAVSKQYDPKND
jgi:hypothetical protein